MLVKITVEPTNDILEKKIPTIFDDKNKFILCLKMHKFQKFIYLEIVVDVSYLHHQKSFSDIQGTSLTISF